ncbi:tail fiber [Staphylococcus phage Madawaska]|nr:tail fiber [Staphylococcus phage Madawaska]
MEDSILIIVPQKTYIPGKGMGPINKPYYVDRNTLDYYDLMNIQYVKVNKNEYVDLNSDGKYDISDYFSIEDFIKQKYLQINEAFKQIKIISKDVDSINKDTEEKLNSFKEKTINEEEINEYLSNLDKIKYDLEDKKIEIQENKENIENTFNEVKEELNQIESFLNDFEKVKDKFQNDYNNTMSLSEEMESLSSSVNMIASLKEEIKNIDDIINNFKNELNNQYNKTYKDIENIKNDYIEEIDSVIKESLKESFSKKEFKSTNHNITSSGENRPLITFIDDDGRNELKTKWEPILKEKKNKLTIATVTKWIDDKEPTVLQWDEIHDWNQKYGVEFVSHTHEHKHAQQLTDEEVEDELRLSRDILKREGLTYNIIVQPFGENTDSVRRISRKYYRANIGTKEGINTPPLDTFRINRITLGEPLYTTFEQYKEKIDEAIINKGWIIFKSHSQYESFDENQLNIIRQIIDYAREQEMIEVNLEEGLDYIGNLIDTGDYTRRSQNIDYYVMDRDGKVYSNFGEKNYYTLKYNTVSIDTPVTEFTDRTTSTVAIVSSNSQGFPNNSSGQLQTVKSESMGLSYQLFMPNNSNSIYKRRWNTTTNNWTEFEDIKSSSNSNTLIQKIESVDVVVPANNYKDVNFTIQGVTNSDNVIVSPGSGIEVGLVYNGFITTTDTVRLRLWNNTSDPITTKRPYKITVVKNDTSQNIIKGLKGDTGQIGPQGLQGLPGLDGNYAPTLPITVRKPKDFNYGNEILKDRIVTDGKGTFGVKYDITTNRLSGGTTYYLDAVNGNDSNDGLSKEKPFKSFKVAIPKVNDNDTIMVADGNYFRIGGTLITKAFNKSINIIGTGNNVNIVMADEPSWTLTSGKNRTYEFSRSATDKVVTLDNSIDIKKVNSIDEVESTPNSWFTDGTKVYSNINDNKPSNSNVIPLISSSNIQLTSLASNIYFENLNIYGGRNCVELNLTSNNSAFFKKCNFYHSASSYNGLAIVGGKNIILDSCKGNYNSFDGLNYHIGADGSKPNIIEINCIGMDNGTDKGLNGVKSNNGSTTHEGLKIIRINGIYGRNDGGNVADVNEGTQSWNLGCIAFESYQGKDFQASSGGNLFLDECIAYGSENSINIGDTDSKVYTRGGRYQNKLIVSTEIKY